MSMISLNIKNKNCDYKTNVCCFSIEESTHSFSNGATDTPRNQLPGLRGDSDPPRWWREGRPAGIPPPLPNW